VSLQALADFCRRPVCDAGSRHDDEIHCGEHVTELSERFPDLALDPVPGDGPSGCFHGDSHTQPRACFAGAGEDHKKSVRRSATAFENPGEITLEPEPVRAPEPGIACGSGPLGHLRLPASRQGVSCARPLARRRARIWRPFLVAMRARNPWVRLRRRLLGWNVRFIGAVSGSGESVRQGVCAPRQRAETLRIQSLLVNL